MKHQEKSNGTMDGRLKANSLARRIADLTAMVNNTKAMAIALERHRQDLLITLATMCKMDGFNVSVVPLVEDDFGVVVAWNRKDVKHHITKEEKDEIMFRVQQLEVFGYRAVPVQSDGHSAQFTFKVR